MKQEEFFKLLDCRLSLIEDEERQDILNEYRQHIAMKIQEDHISEEDALADFGDVDSFADEILSAYHVRTGEPAKQTRQMAFSIQQKLSSYFGKARELFRTCGKKVSHFLGRCGEKLHGLFHWEKKGPKPKCEGTPFWKHCISWIVFAFRTGLRWCSNLLIGGLGAMFAVLGAIQLVMLGCCIVVATQGYPLIGTTILLLGLLLCSGALTLLCCRMIRKKEDTHNA